MAATDGRMMDTVMTEADTTEQRPEIRVCKLSETLIEIEIEIEIKLKLKLKLKMNP